MDSLSEQDENRIDDYLHGELNEEERQAFEQELKERPELAAAFEDQRQFYLTLWWESTQAERESLKASLAVSAEAEVKPLYRQRWFQLAVAASMLLLLIVAITRNWAQQRYGSSQLAMAYLDSPAMVAGLTKSDAQTDSLTAIRRRLSQEQYRRVSQAIGSAPSSARQPILAFWWGYAHLQLGLQGDQEALAEAKASFSSSRWQKAATNWQQTTGWYRVLTGFALGNPDLAQLEEIARNAQHPYQPAAQDLLADQQAFFRRLAK